ncbi:MAG TPA: hypothetical protein VJ124_25795 [Pyrinomonadaceae bacterium]|nr:hypothetical protein [Pyrinomonadaceae bacterium]
MSDQRISPTEGTLLAEIRLYYDLHRPEIQPAPLLIALHGYGANKRQMMKEALAMSPPEFAVASLQGVHQHLKEPKDPGGPLRFGFGWLTNFHPEEAVTLHHRAILNLINTCVAEAIATPESIFLLGFSQSCALNYRFAFTYPDRLRGVIGICGGLPGDWETSEIYKPTHAAVLHIAGTQDQYYPPERVGDYKDRLQTRANVVEFRSYNAGHEIVSGMREDVCAWLKSRTALPSK